MFVHFHDLVIDTNKLLYARAYLTCVDFKFTNGNIETYLCEDGQKELNNFYDLLDARVRAKQAMRKSR